MGRGKVAVVPVAAALAGCLSGGPPPSGQRLIVGRDFGLGMAFLVTPQVTGLLLHRPDAQGQLSQLHFVTLPAVGAPSEDRLLAEDASPLGFLLPDHDARGRVVVQTALSAPDPNMPYYTFDLQLVDPASGARLDLGPSNNYLLSRSGARLMYSDAGHDARMREIDDDSERSLGPSDEMSSKMFVGEDFYYTHMSDATLWRAAPGADPVSIADGVAYVNGYATDGGAMLVLRPPPPSDSRVREVLRVMDPTTLQQTPLPPVLFIDSFSPDGRWILADPLEAARSLQGDEPRPLILIDPATGAIDQEFDVPSPAGSPEWRPGHDELWISGGSETVIAAPGSPPVTLDRPAVIQYRPRDAANSVFARGGQLFFWLAPDPNAPFPGDRTPVEVSYADAPEGQAVTINPTGSGVGSYWELADGRLLAEDWYKSADRSDLIVVDPATGTQRVIGEAGSAFAVGKRRVLAELRVADGRGDLVLIDLDTGAQTKLAEGVTNAVVEPRPGDDPLASGTRVVFTVINPIASPYDGLWLVTLP